MSKEDLAQGRAAFERLAWREAFSRLGAADEAEPLGAEDLELLAKAAYLIGREPESTEAWSRAYHARLEAGEQLRAARDAFWLAFGLMNRGEWARGGGWLGRSMELVESSGTDCVERGYLMIPAGIKQLAEGSAEGAREAFSGAIEIGLRHQEPDLLAMGRMGVGTAEVAMGRTAEGVALLDEVMVSVTAGETSAVVGGIIYCGVIAACQEIFDLRRATEWTVALNEWCAKQPDLVPYRGQCLVHRSQIMHLHGDWAHALEEARRARERLSDPPGQPAVGEAWYQLGELHRSRGSDAEAEEAYHEGNRWGRSPQPGLSLLRLAQGKHQVAAAAIRRELHEATQHNHRFRLLPAAVEIMLAVGDPAAARAAADELVSIATSFSAPLLDAMARRALGSVLLAEGDAKGALGAIREAMKAWQALDAPYEEARTRVLLARACEMLGDDDTAAMELAAAKRVFEQLGATHDLDALAPADAPDAPPAGLTAREVEVLRLVAGGATNRAIAENLVISEKTVARHVSNIFVKLGVSSRAAATAFAYENQLV